MASIERNESLNWRMRLPGWFWYVPLALELQQNIFLFLSFEIGVFMVVYGHGFVCRLLFIMISLARRTYVLLLKKDKPKT